MYFEMEQTQLDAIWAATDNAWNFDFDHRNAIERQITEAQANATLAAIEMQVTPLNRE